MGDTQPPPRTPTDVKFRSTGSKFMPNHLDAVIEGKKKPKKVEQNKSDSDHDKQQEVSDDEDLGSNFFSQMY